MTTRTTVVPRSRATNAYDLLTDVCAAVLDEPKRLNMNHWLLRGRALRARIEPTRRPTCDTVACAAGWIVTLAGRVTAEALGDDDPRTGDIRRTQTQALELLGAGMDRLYPDAAVDVVPGVGDLRTDLRDLFGSTTGYAHPEGTLGYAEQVVQQIQRVRDEHADLLKAWPVTIEPVAPVAPAAAPPVCNDCGFETV